MRILQISYEFPPLGGGAGVICRHTSIGLAKLGHQVTVISTWYTGEKEIEEKDGIRILRVKSRRKKEFQSNPIEMLDYARKAIDYFNAHFTKDDFDVSICHYTLPSGIVGRQIQKQHEIPYYIVSHGHDVPFVFPKQMLFFHIGTYFWLKSLMNNAKGMFVQSNEMQKATLNFMGQKYSTKLYKIPNGCNTEFFYPDYALKAKTLKIILVGRLVEQKDPITFLKALKRLAEKNICFEAYIIGDGPMREKIEQFISKNNLNNYVTLTGWVSKDEMRAHYQSAHIQVICSIFEGMSIAALEGLVSGLYLITTPVSGNNEIIDIEKNGAFFNYKDHKKLEENILSYNNLFFKNNYFVNTNIVQASRERYEWRVIVSDYDKILNNSSSIK